MPATPRKILGFVTVTGMLLWYEACRFNTEICTLNPTPAEESSRLVAQVHHRIGNYNTARFSSAIQTFVLNVLTDAADTDMIEMYYRLFLSATKEIGNSTHRVHVY